MKKENISDALNNIDFDMVEDVYESTKAKKKSNKKILLLLLLLVRGLYLFGKITLMSLFTLK